MMKNYDTVIAWLRGRPRAVILAATLLTIVAIGAAWLAGSNNDPQKDVLTFTVKPGPLTISVSESGTIQSREQVVIKSMVEGSATILFLVPEGTMVKEGDLLVELDASQLQDNLVDQQIKLQNADAAFVGARENLAVVKNQAEADIARAGLDLQFARQDLEKYIKGEYPSQVKEAESRIALAEAQLKQAAENMDWSTVLSNEKYISKTELEADQLANKKAELDLQLARDDLELLRQYTHPRRMAELNSDVSQTDMALERTKRKASADVVQAEATLQAKEAELKQQQTKLEKLREQIEKTRIYAPRAAMVVYATSTQSSRHGNVEPLAEGQQVRERQELIYLPTADEVIAKISVHEADLDKVRPGLPVRVTVDALPGQVLTGSVTKIAPLPNASSMWMNPDLKIYDTEVQINGSVPGLRSGMSCEAEIIAQRYAEALFVPVQAVIRQGKQPTVYVRAGGAFAARPVEIGLDNNRMVHVLSGLKAGDQVLMTPPLAAAAVEAEDWQEQPDAGPAPQLPTAAQVSAPATDEDQGRPQREDRAPMTAEQREAMRQRMQNMTEEQRQQLRDQWRERRQQEQKQDTLGEQDQPSQESKP